MDAALVIVGAVMRITIPLLLAEVRKRGINQRATGLDSLKFELGAIQSAIKNHSNSQDPLIAEWIKRVTCLAYDIEDCVDSFCAKKITSSGFKTRINELKNSAVDTRSTLERYQISSSESGTQHRDHLQNDGEIVDLNDPIGMMEHLQNLRAIVRSPCTKKLKVISVVGFGGTGKTRLADLLYKDTDVCSDFPLGASVRVVKKAREVLDEIFEELLKAKNKLDASTSSQSPQNLNSCHGDASMPVPLQAPRLWQCLGAYSYRILLDDVRDTKVARDIISAFHHPKVNAKGIIIMTTNMMHRATENCSTTFWAGHVYQMRPLDIMESKLLFQKAANVYNVVSGQTEADKSEIEKKCDGVALALISIAQFGNGDLSWCNEAWSALFAPEDHTKLARMQRVLAHTYNTASGLGLRAMLLYFSMFPAGHPVRKGSMIRRCLAEGILTPRAQHGEGQEYDEPENLMKKLIDLNAIWPIQMSINQGAKTCKPPQLLHQYISCKSETEDFINLDCNNNNAQPVRRLSLYRDGAADPTRELRNIELPYLRTLAVSSNKKGDDVPSFAKYEQLRVLDLEAYPGIEKEQFDEICDKLKLLKYLSLRTVNVSQVPSNISSLYLLETLDLGNKNKNVILLPIGAIELPHLKHLIGKFELLDSPSRIVRQLAGPFKKMTKKLFQKKETKESKLERFSGFITREGKGFPPLFCDMNMTNLKKVKIWFYPDADAESLTTHLPKAIQIFLPDGSADLKNDTTTRRSLSLDFQECPYPEKLLDSLVQARGGKLKLYSLKLSGRRNVIRQIPSFGASRIQGITKLCLSWSKETLLWEDILYGVSELPDLEYLKLQAEKIEGMDIEEAGELFKNVLYVNKAKFNTLKRMCLQTKRPLPQLKTKDAALNSLASLHLLCNYLDDDSANQIAQLNGLKEVALLSNLGNDTKDKWREAARKHSSVPYVLFIQYPHSE